MLLASILADTDAFNPLFKVLFTFPSRYLFTIGLGSVSIFGRKLPPLLRSESREHDSQKVPDCAHCLRRDGLITLSEMPFQAVLRLGCAGSNLQENNAGYPSASQSELRPFHSPLLRESYSFSSTPRTDMLKFSG